MPTVDSEAIKDLNIERNSILFWAGFKSNIYILFLLINIDHFVSIETAWDTNITVILLFRTRNGFFIQFTFNHFLCCGCCFHASIQSSFCRIVAPFFCRKFLNQSRCIMNQTAMTLLNTQKIKKMTSLQNFCVFKSCKLLCTYFNDMLPIA